ncbi:BgTH12-01905 [Blumeria graminis f. sp. triticale]|uniref:GTPase-activating protein GYP7 n=3 Tax=Blumeria graminis TaxID=34373 RepID=A0A061HKZ1_BLUGR|nr:GTPase-activating protein [Blumeria graminis f. sp. tritici 96224]CAD6501655.1 BgTH12-01905 [Blumeria graminis f. sp. triticale]VDB84245.1 Bgt-4977 [Blumeria graminis f. sp. tritici]
MTSQPSPSKAGIFHYSNKNNAHQDTDRDESTSKSFDKEANLLYSKSKASLTYDNPNSSSEVYLHPTSSAKDNIPGYLALLYEGSSADLHPIPSTPQDKDLFLLAWLPEHTLGDTADIYAQVDLMEDLPHITNSFLVPRPPITLNLTSIGYSAFAVPLSSIYSLFIRPPSPGWWFGSLIINSKTGYSFPALFFHDSECQSTIAQKKKLVRENFDPFGVQSEIFWGGSEVLRWLNQYIDVQRSSAEPNTYLVDATDEDRQAFGGESVTPSVSTSKSREKRNLYAADFNSNQTLTPRDIQSDPLSKFVKGAAWNLMEKLSRVTTFARRTTDSVVENPNIPPQVRRLLRNPEVQTLQDEFDSARVYLARWAMGIVEQSERDRNSRICMAKEVLEIEATDVGDFELLNAEKEALSSQGKRKIVTLKDWNKVKERIFYGGLNAEDDVRKEAWLFLLGIYSWDSTKQERKAKADHLMDQYVKLKGAWWKRLVNEGDEGETGEWWREQKCRIEKDVHRTDRSVPLFAGEDIPHPDPMSPFADVGTNVHLEQLKHMLLTYNEYNSELGYVQGMSDLLAPLYAVLQDDAIAFWAFTNFMTRMEQNFLRDQSGMRRQLLTLDHLVQLMDPKLYLHLQSADSTNFFFFFRMLLVWFKREFSWEDVLRLWECLFTDYLTSNFHLFVALAILEKHRDVIMEHLKRFDEVLKYVNELSSTIDLDSTLIRAEKLFRRFQRLVESIDKRANFPAPQVRRRIIASEPLNKASVSTSNASSSGIDPADAKFYNPSMRGQDNLELEESKLKKQDRKFSDSEPDKIIEIDEGPQIISPELRQLLSRETIVVPKNVTTNNGS